jgi:phosphatidylserine/phosphatidylglycerophosphate/cardiolipin synthase-like enzyme
VYFTTPDDDPQRPGNIADKLAGYIDQTQDTLDVAAFELDNEVVTAALLRAVGRGVKVRLVTDTDYAGESGPERLRAAGVPVVEDGRTALMHNKFMVFDRRAVWTGSMNFTENCAYRNDNHGVLIADRDVADSYATKFGWMFTDRKFGGKPSASAAIPHPRVTLPDGTPLECYFSTHDGLAGRVTRELEGAKKSIHFLAFSFTHSDIGGAMAAAAEAGLDVGGVIENSQASGKSSQLNALTAAGVRVHRDANPKNMHHKFIVIDSAVVIAGSFNFSVSADNSNDENVVIIRDHDVAAKFEAEYRRVHEKARREK